MKKLLTAEIYPNSANNGYMVCVLDKNGAVDYGFDCAGSGVKVEYTIKTLKAIKVKVLKVASMVSTEFRADLIDAGFTVESL
jgi:hypothetical protein